MAPRAPYRGPSPFLLFPAIVAAELFVGYLVALTGIPLDDVVAPLIDTLLLAGIAIGILQLVVVAPGWLTWHEMGFRRPSLRTGSWVGSVAMGAGLAVPALIATGIIGGILMAILGVEAEAPVTPTFELTGFLVQLLAAGLIAPLWEETFFRGYATTAWSRTRGAKWAIVGGTLFFAAIHVPGLLGADLATAAPKALLAFAIRVPVGFLLSWLFLSRRSLAASMSLHVAYNAIALIVTFAAGPRP